MMKKIFLLLLLFCFGTFSLKAQWSNVGNIYGGTYMLEVINNELYASGACNWPGIGLKSSIVKWDGSIWTPVARTDTLGAGYANDIILYNNELYVGGQFCGIGKWNGSNWTYLGNGIPSGASYIKDLEVYNGNLYAAGRFSSISGVNTNGIAKWNGTNWSAVGGGLHGGTITPNGYALMYMNDLFVGGSFDMAGNVPANNIAKWNGSTWDSLGSGTNERIDALVVDTINNFLYLGGSFTWAGGKNAYTIAKWDDFQLDSVGNSSTLGYGITCLEMYHGQLYAGGFGVTGTITDTILIRWDGKQWYHVIGPDNSVWSLQVYNDELYVGGGFTQMGNDTSIKLIARYSAPWDSSCKFLQPIIETMHSLSVPNGLANTFYYSDSVKVQFYNNIQSAAMWQWDFGDGNTGTGQTPNHYYNTAGTYNVSVIVNYPWGPYGTCIDTAQKTITVLHGTGLKEYTKEKLNFKLYPNPTTGGITVEVTLPNNTPAELRAYSSYGSLQGEYSLHQGFNKVNIPASQWTSGVSLVGLYVNGKQVLVEKVVKQ